MRKALFVPALAAVLALGATGITTPALANDNLLGTGMGAALGGLLGSQIARGDARLATTAAGVFVGGLIGNNLSRSSGPDYGRRYHHQAVYYPPVQETYYYPQVNYVPNYVAPPSLPPQNVTYVDPYSGGYCREYSQQVRVGNRIQKSYGTACLQPDGSWRIAN